MATVTIAGALTWAAGCRETPGGIPDATPHNGWGLVQDGALAGADFVAAGGAGEELWAVAADGAVILFDGVAWSRIDAPIAQAPAGIWGAAHDDVWVAAGDLLHWDGAAWTTADLDALVEGAPHAVRQVWGSAADDVWAIIEILGPIPKTDPTILVRYDGSSWGQVDVDPSLEPDWPHQMRTGCSGDRSHAWMIEDFDSIYAWDGAGWTVPPEIPELLDGPMCRLGCSGPDMWVLGELSPELTGRDCPEVLRWNMDEWRAPQLIDVPGDLQLTDLWGGQGEAWVIGAENDPVTGSSRPDVWHYVDQTAEPTLPGDLGLPALSDTQSLTAPLLRAVWTTASGTTYVFGAGGLVLAHGSG